MVQHFPAPGLQLLSALISFIGVTLLTHCLSRRLAAEDLSSWQAIRQISWPRLCVLLVFLDSLLFLIATGVLILGIGLETSLFVCASGLYLCVLFYATSKVLIYLFLSEKVYLVWSPTASTRLKSRMYLFCVGTVAAYGVVVAVMAIGRVHLLREHDGLCVIGLRQYSSILLLSYDLYINILLTILFVWPLFISRAQNPFLKRVALRTLVAAGAALTTSTINITVLTVMQGRELGWVCLGSCGADVIFNALALFWVTTSRTGRSTQSTTDKAVAAEQRNATEAGRTDIRTSVRPSTIHQSPSSSETQKPSSLGTFQNSSPSMVAFPALNTGERHKRSPSVFRNVARLVRGHPSPQVEEHDLQVRITREYNVTEEGRESEAVCSGDSKLLVAERF